MLQGYREYEAANEQKLIEFRDKQREKIKELEMKAQNVDHLLSLNAAPELHQV